jgi:hypothetical protein
VRSPSENALEPPAASRGGAHLSDRLLAGDLEPVHLATVVMDERHELVLGSLGAPAALALHLPLHVDLLDLSPRRILGAHRWPMVGAPLQPLFEDGAIRIYLAGTIVDELGVGPTTETDALHLEILRSV